ncbi:family 1 glycosylhydrolase [Acidianus sp. HS-5]|uniref:family 1 glycosylhydrolase n=1 Tax=Acidianus sp. HS-5 TaxID=2886040 RepID=UPI001F01435B|nr:family 1 glycosylhydrolase [Acidianus sp. HS-5]BDC18679.1 beta-galactosidase [Acidianus sp. HS-5]
MKFGFSISSFQFEELNQNSDWYLWLTDYVNLVSRKVVGELPTKNFYLTKYKEIHDIAVKLNANIWRTNLSWGRLFPSKDKVSTEAVEKYKEVLKDLKEKGFQVILCLNHFDLPIWIHDPITARDSLLTQGPLGWYSSTTVEEFVKYSRFVHDTFSEYVDMWCTFNEPNLMINFGYLQGVFPPGISSRNAYEIALNNVIKAHQKVYDELKGEKVGIVYNIPAVQGKGEEEILDFLKKIEFDWLGVNYYTRLVTDERGIPLEGYGPFCQFGSKEGREVSDYGWEVYPEGLIDVLRKASSFGKSILVTENGVADEKDRIRPKFINEHVNAIKKSGVKVDAYMYWSLYDNFEWNFGYRMKFGLYDINLNPRPSASVFKELQG